MMVMFRAYRDEDALLVSEDGVTLAVPTSLLQAAGLLSLRTGQRLILTLDDHGSAVAIRLP